MMLLHIHAEHEDGLAIALFADTASARQHQDRTNAPQQTREPRSSPEQDRDRD